MDSYIAFIFQSFWHFIGSFLILCLIARTLVIITSMITGNYRDKYIEKDKDE